MAFLVCLLACQLTGQHVLLNGGDIARPDSNHGYTTRVENARRVIVRDRHFALGDSTGLIADSLAIGKAEQLTIERCSLRWGIDENLDIYDVDRVELRDSFIYESLNDTGLHQSGGGPNGTSHGCGFLYSTRRKNCELSVNQVLMAHHNYRALGNTSVSKGGTITSDFCNVVVFDIGNYCFQDQSDGSGEIKKNLRGCLFIQPRYEFKPSMWRTAGQLYIDDCWCIDRDGKLTALERQFDAETKARLVNKPFKIKGMAAAEKSEKLLGRLIERLTQKIHMDFHDVRALGRIASWKPGQNWTGIIDSQQSVEAF